MMFVLLASRAHILFWILIKGSLAAGITEMIGLSL
jgi:hypothetical protein